jgi:hypothetical protein
VNQDTDIDGTHTSAIRLPSATASSAPAAEPMADSLRRPLLTSLWALLKFELHRPVRGFGGWGRAGGLPRPRRLAEMEFDAPV